jgi:hypothetical protein
MGETLTQIQSFANEYAPYANQAGSALGVSPDIILAQWGLETGYGTQLSGTNNLGNITNPSGGYANYSSIGSFLSAFISNIQSHPTAVNAGISTANYAEGLATGGNGSYYGTQSPASYTSGLEGVENTISNDASSIFQALLTPTAGSNTMASTGTNSAPATGATTTTSTGGATGSTGSTAPCSGISSIFNYSCYASIAGNLALIVIAVVILLGILLMVADGNKGATA